MKKGFTLVELLAVIVILGIILSIAVPTISGIINNATSNAFMIDAKLVLRSVSYKQTEDSSFDIATLNETNIGTVLGVNSSNYQSVDFISVGGDTKVIIVGQNKWNGLVAYGTNNNITIASMPSGLIGYWRLNGNANDSSGYNNNGTVNGATLTTDQYGRSNNAYAFNGTSNYIDVGDNPVLGLTNQGSISLWAKSNRTYPSDDTSTRYRGLFSKTINGNDGGSSYYIDWYGTNSTHRLRGGIENGSTDNKAIVDMVLGTTWHHIVFTWNGSKLDLYVDNNLSDEEWQTINAKILSKTVEIGRAYNDNSYAWAGNIADVRIYNRALSIDEISTLYNAGI